MKKILLVLSIILLFGCSLSNTPSTKVENYLNKYINLDDDVITDLDTTIINENLSNDNTTIYKKVLERQYENMSYEIIDESINKNKAYVKVNITNYNLYKSINDSNLYLNNHIDEFSDINNLYDNESFMKYKLNQMLNTNETIDNEVTFELNKKDNEWYLVNPSKEILKKIHGMYNYGG